MVEGKSCWSHSWCRREDLSMFGGSNDGYWARGSGQSSGREGE
jgi:hypothetical protein